MQRSDVQELVVKRANDGRAYHAKNCLHINRNPNLTKSQFEYTILVSAETHPYALLEVKALSTGCLEENNIILTEMSGLDTIVMQKLGISSLPHESDMDIWRGMGRVYDEGRKLWEGGKASAVPACKLTGFDRRCQRK